MKKLTKKSLYPIILAVAALLFAFLREQGIFDLNGGRKSSEFIMTVLELDSADCILLENKNSAVLVDGGENRDAGAVIGFLKAKKITVIDLVIATHPHSDHIGGLDDVLSDDDFTIKRILYPDVPQELLPETSATSNFYQAASECGAQKMKCEPGEKIEMDGITITVLAPLRNDYNDLNNFSVVARADCGDVSVLLTGDAEKISEKDMLADSLIKPLLNCDVLKVGHHGGNTSTTVNFIYSVLPKIALIPARADTDSFYLMENAIRNLKESGSKVYNTCENGRLICSVKDGELSAVCQR